MYIYKNHVLVIRVFEYRVINSPAYLWKDFNFFKIKYVTTYISEPLPLTARQTK